MFGLGNIVGEIIGAGRDYLQGEREVKKAIVAKKVKLITQRTALDGQWEQKQIDKSDVLLRRVSFSLLSTPFVVAMFDPVAVQEYFTVALNAMPEWYIQMYFTIIGGIWGVATLKNLFKK